MGKTKGLPYFIEKFLKPDDTDADHVVFILPDQLNLGVWPEWVRNRKPPLLFIESEEENGRLPYHKKRLTYLISSQRHFAMECDRQGYPVWYLATRGRYVDILQQLLAENDSMEITYMKPTEWDTREELRAIKDDFSKQLKEIDNRFFMADPDSWTDKVADGYRLEYFYREMRRETGYLMNGEEPEGGEWNYDKHNREPLPDDCRVPEVTGIDPDDITDEVMKEVEENYPDHFGEIKEFRYAVTRDQALELMHEFIDDRLANFGPYEDAMTEGEPVLFHSALSPYLNNGLLVPTEICEAAVEAYRAGKAPINSVEGLIRQIIGWREYVRIYYEAMMPGGRNANHFDFEHPLPAMFWNGKTDMNCMKQCLQPVIQDGYSHHIQRLMVLSNFSNLSKSDPRELNRWFRLAYVDAHEWVVLPNVLGMSTYADGGVLASKPYISSGNYINKMSDYCDSCAYDIDKKDGEKACPFNYLYWNFVNEQRETLNESGRINFMVNMYDKKPDDQKRAIQSSTENFLSNLERYNPEN